MPFFSFLNTTGPTPEEVRNSLIMVACQMLAGGLNIADAEAISDGKLWIVNATTEFKKASLGPQLFGTLFKGEGGLREGRSRILQPFGASYLVNPELIDEDLMGESLENPDGFLNLFQERYEWSLGRIIRVTKK